jgi:hypothetical protein
LARLAARGHDVTVYCWFTNITNQGSAYRGMRLVKLPTMQSKHSTPSPTATACSRPSTHCRGLRRHPLLQYRHQRDVDSAPAGHWVILNVDGLDWKRKKWGRFAQWCIRTAERWGHSFSAPGRHRLPAGPARFRITWLLGLILLWALLPRSESTARPGDRGPGAFASTIAPSSPRRPSTTRPTGTAWSWTSGGRRSRSTTRSSKPSTARFAL